MASARLWLVPNIKIKKATVVVAFCLPTEIIFSGTNRKINYLYTATGQKVQKVVNDGVALSITDYLGGYQYNNSVLQFFPHAEGYVKNTVVAGVNSYDYVFSYLDHLGNVRLNYGLVAGVLTKFEENNYYPFGLKHKNYNYALKEIQEVKEIKIVQEYEPAKPEENIAEVPEIKVEVFEKKPILKEEEYFEKQAAIKNQEHEVNVNLVPNSGYQIRFNSKSWEDELDLNMYAMDARQYDPAIARWVVQDPVIHHSATPYGAFNGNPIFWADPSGMDGEHYNWDTKKYEDSKGKEVSFDAAMAGNGMNADGSEKTETPPDDITVNSSGIVTSVVKNDKPNRFFDEKGKEFNFNDGADADKNMLSNNFKIGERLFFSISKEENNILIIRGGLEPLIYNQKYIKSFGFVYFKYMALKSAAENSHDITKADFTFSQLSNYGGTNGNGYGYFKFGNEATLYNTYDAGNFMWGNWMKFSLFTYGEVKLGSEKNENFQDSSADQRAIKNGYKF